MHTRSPIFYQKYKVPDTFDGRFDLLVLHIFCLLDVVIESEHEDAEAFNQAMFDTLFMNMDQSLRELGIGDTGVSKRMKAMMLSFNGRMHAYKNAQNDPAAMTETIKRNVYANDGDASSLYAYIQEFHLHLKQQNIEHILSGELSLDNLE